jgi:hypothetical protein
MKRSSVIGNLRTRTRGVPDGIGDRTGRSGDADLAHAFDTERVDMRIVFLDQNRFERRHIGVHRNMVLGQVSVHRTARIDYGLLAQRERYTPDHAAIVLTPRHARIDDPSSGEGADQARRANLPDLGIDFDLSEDCAMRFRRRASAVPRRGGRPRLRSLS